MEALEPTNKTALEQLEDEFKQLQLSLPKQIWLGDPMHLYQGFWCLSFVLEGAVSFQTHFEALDTDIVLASIPKTGTTWLKSLLYATINREKNSKNHSQHPLHTTNPHELVPHFELEVYKSITENQPALTKVSSPRLFATHLPYLSLASSIKTSKCRIVYICRNPFDTFVSLWHFYLQFEMSKEIKPDVDMMEDYVDKYCKGIIPFGPLEDHLLGYWKESMKNPQKVLFLEYEGLKKEPKVHLKKLAEFVGFPFSEKEEKNNVLDEIIKLCSLKSLKEMEVNQSGKFYPWFDNKALFRLGKVGDWTNHLTPTMVKRIDAMQEKLSKAGFSFAYFQRNN